VSSKFKNQFIKAVTGSFGLKIANTGLLFFMSVILARYLGTEGFGQYSYAFSWTAFLAIFASLGCNKLLTKEFAIYNSQQSWGLMKGLLRWTNIWVLITSLFTMTIAIILTWLLVANDNLSLAWVLTIAFLSLPFATLRQLRMGAMQGLKAVNVALIPEYIIMPILIIVASGLIFFFSNQELSPIMASLITLIAIIVSFLIGWQWLNQVIPSSVNNAIFKYQTLNWRKTALPLMFLGSLHIINSKLDILMLGNLQGATSVAIYVVVVNIALLIVFIQKSIEQVLAPNIAELYAQNEIQKLQKIVSKCSRTMLLLSTIFAVILVFSRHLVLGIFGNEYLAGGNTLIILTVAQLINTGSGPVALLLNMTGYGNLTARTALSTVFANIVLNAILIPLFDFNGAAIATAISIIGSNLVNCIFVYQKLNIKASGLYLG
jgi:O-antigen/teichoic acid export membrane protein